MGVYTSVNFYPVHLLVNFEEMAKVFLIQFQYKLNIIMMENTVVSKMFVEYQFSWIPLFWGSAKLMFIEMQFLIKY